MGKVNTSQMINTAEILCVGTELLLGDIVNTNAAFLSFELAALGINLYRQSVVGDNEKRLAEALREALSRADLVITSGGLGPTSDDITKETVASVFGRELFLDAESMQKIEDYFAFKGILMPKSNRKQALAPKGAIILKNEHGTAPGFVLSNDERTKTVIMLPGPPHELIPMFKNSVIPYLFARTQSVIRSRNIHIFGIGESALESELCDMMETGVNPTVAPYAKEGEVNIRVTAKGKSEQECFALCDIAVNKIKASEVGKYIYGVDIGSLEAAVVKALTLTGETVAFAESCTGGLLSKRVVDIAGASAVYIGGAVCYSNNSKTKILGVPAEIIDKYGAVSPEAAAYMAKGARELTGAVFGVATTGIAGPANGSLSDKPIGLVYIALSSEKTQRTVRLNLSGGREHIRKLAASNALYLLLQEINAGKSAKGVKEY